MLYTIAVEPNTLSLLKRLMAMQELKNFSLVGGTALALKFGHRKSLDLDIFTNEKLDYKRIVEALEKEFEKEFIFDKQHITFAVFCEIKNVKVDIVYFPHVQIAPSETIDGITMYSNKDIAAMKINAILGRGVKKDFWDIVELLKEFSLDEIIQFHKQKYPSQMLMISIPNALTYFEDAENSEDPISLKGQTWAQIKKELQLKVREFLS
jgi:nucleotidyltransferase AbiEii toxin of type IV toxin-antitoxin system